MATVSTTIARKERDTSNWFLGSITDENAREVDISLDFLDDGADDKVKAWLDRDAK